MGKDSKRLINCSFSAVTEVWDFQYGESEIIEPTLARYADGIALFAVDIYFCNI